MPISPQALEKLRRRVQSAESLAQSWQTTLIDAYRFTMPERYAVAHRTGDGQPVPPSFREVYDSTALDALEDFSGFISESLYPFDKHWFQFIPREDQPEEEREQLKGLAEQLTDRVWSLFSRSNFHPAVTAANRDLAIGTKFLRSEIDPHDPTRILFTPVPAHVWAIEEDSAGRIAGIFRKVRTRARDIETAFPGGKFSSNVRKRIEDEPEAWVEVWETLAHDPISTRWGYVAYEADGDQVVLEQVHRSAPVIVTRWSRTPGQVWGVGPTLRALPDIRTLNKTVELILKNASIAVTGIWQADDDGVMNVANIQLVPGAIIPKAVGSAGLQPLEAPGRFDVAQLVIEDLRERINRAHHRIRLPEREMTAWEAAERTREAQRELRGTFGQLKAEDVEPVVMRVLDLGRQMGEVPEEEIERLLSLELIGPLAQAIREDEAAKMVQFVQAVAAVFGPEAAVAAIKPEEFIPALAERLGVKSDYVKSPDELRELAMEAAAAQAQMQEQEMMARGAGAGAGAGRQVAPMRGQMVRPAA